MDENLVKEYTGLKEKLTTLDKEESRLKGEVSTYDTQIAEGLAKLGVASVEEAKLKSASIEASIRKAVEGAKVVIETAERAGFGKTAESIIV